MKFIGQKGFTLLEMSIVLALATMGIMATLKMRATQIQIDDAKSVAQIYERLNNAAGSYMTLYYKEIIEKATLYPGCSKPAYEIPDDKLNSVIAHGTDCKITLKTNGQAQSINNFMQPTPKELKTLGLLTGNDGGYHDTLPLPSSSSLIANNVSNDPKFGVHGAAARNGMAFLIQLMCVGDEPAITEPIVKTGECKSDAYDLRSLVYNIQPYSDASNNDVLLYRVNAAGGGNIYLSDSRFSGKLKSSGGTGELENPVFYKPVGKALQKGAPFILAMRNGYGSSGMDEFVRRDGSRPLTGTWNVGNNSITGINQVSAATLTANTATVSGALSAGSVSASTVTGTTGIFGIWSGATTAALNATSAFFSGWAKIGGDLTVSGASQLVGNVKTSGDLTVSGASQLDGNVSMSGNMTVSGPSDLKGSLKVAGATNLTGGTKVADFRLENEAVFGGTCNLATQTLARAASSSTDYSNSLRLLVCDPETGKWVRAQADYKSEIDVIRTAVTKLGGDISTVNSNVSTINNTLANQKTLVAEMFHASWPAASYFPKGAEGYKYQANGRAWQKTPWACLPRTSDLQGTFFTVDANNDSLEFNGTTYAVPVGTPTIVILADYPAQSTMVNGVLCLPSANPGNPSFYHIGLGPREQNMLNGNKCHQGLNSAANRPYRDPYELLVSRKDEPCELINYIHTPNWSTVNMSAWVMAYVRKNK
jgi:prepilin-type N-terminal cleavage/methylation domain-containing protein